MYNLPKRNKSNELKHTHKNTSFSYIYIYIYYNLQIAPKKIYHYITNGWNIRKHYLLLLTQDAMKSGRQLMTCFLKWPTVPAVDTAFSHRNCISPCNNYQTDSDTNNQTAKWNHPNLSDQVKAYTRVHIINHLPIATYCLASVTLPVLSFCIELNEYKEV